MKTYDNLDDLHTTMNFFYTNIRSIITPGKLDELKCIIKSIGVHLHLILITESWIKTEEEANRIQIPNYTHYYNHRTDRRGGGVTIFAHKDLKHSLSEELYINGETNRYRSVLRETGYSILNKVEEEYATRSTATTGSILDHEFCENINLNSYVNLDKSIKTVLAQSKITQIKIQNPPQKDWINKNIINNINNRNVLWQNLKNESNNEQLLKKYNKARNYVTELISQTKSNYYFDSFGKCINNPKKMWRLIDTLSKNKIKDGSSPPKLKTDFGTITDGKDICEVFNTFFATIGSHLANKIPHSFHNNTTYTFTNKTSTTGNELSMLGKCTEDEVARIIDHLDPNTSSGIDEPFAVDTPRCVTAKRRALRHALVPTPFLLSNYTARRKYETCNITV
ncbi:putative tick transposon [Operophtera brumata]|uniref:Putative tick transposon n=1 Tax=Operophtera brumata TaxID=104452 RepID=A0A0L7LPA4_OPEBR|nr:putative tick transposon [Operophtera brumata]